MTAPPATLAPCPRCGADLAQVRGAIPWCPACEWQLDLYDPYLAPWRGTRWLGRWGHRRSMQLDAAMHEELRADPSGAAAPAGKGQAWLVGVSVTFVVAALALVGLLVWLFIGSGLPVGVRLVLALPVVGLLVLLLPSPGQVPDHHVLSRADAPELHRLLDRVGAAVGTPVPDVVAVDLSVNAGVARLGWRQRSVLVIGMPLWVMLAPEGRVSVLAHEFGHLVNGGPMRSALTFPARSFGARAVQVTGGRNPWRRAAEGIERASWGGAGVTGLVVHTALALANVAGATFQLLVDSVAMPDSRRAEYRADLIARSVGGSEAFLESSARLLMAEQVWQDLWHQAPRLDWSELSAAADVSLGRLRAQVPVRRQLSRRATDLWSSHPSDDRRMSLLETLAPVAPSVLADETSWDVVDTELAGWTKRAHRALLGTRDRL